MLQMNEQLLFIDCLYFALIVFLHLWKLRGHLCTELIYGHAGSGSVPMRGTCELLTEVGQC